MNEEQMDGLDWRRIGTDLDTHGCAVIGSVLSGSECSSLSENYDVEELFRSRVVMARHGFGRGEYKYFTYPLPSVVATLRTAMYRPLAEIANRWNAALGVDTRYPAEHAAYLERCHRAGQTNRRPCSFGTRKATTTVCTRTSTENTYFHSS